MGERRNYLLLGGVIAALACILFIVVWFIKSNGSEKNETDPNKTPTVQGGQTQTQQTVYELTKDISYQYDAETKTVTLLGQFSNSAGNERFLRYSVRQKSDGEILYESEPLQPGSSLTSIAFVFDAAPGEYELYLISASLDPTNKEEKNSVMVPLTLTIP